MLLGLQIVPGDENLLLEASQADIVHSNLGHQRYQHCTAIFHGGLKIRLSGFNAAPALPRKCHFPGGIEAGLEVRGQRGQGPVADWSTR